MELEASYPPLFRQLRDSAPAVDTDNGSRTTNPIREPDPIPLIDLQRLDVEPERLREACREWGMFRVVNHGVPLDLLTRLRSDARRLFSLPFESKQASVTTPLSYFWGTPVLTPPSGSALSRGSRSMNWVEGLHVPVGQLSLLGDGGGDDDDVATVLASLRNPLQEYGAHLARIAKLLFQAMAEDLRLDPTHSKSYLLESTGFIRLHRYPHCSKANGDVPGMEAHSDSAVLSILCEDEVGGLELHNGKQWIREQPTPDALIVNVGDLLQVMSDDKYVSVKHRVMVNELEDRISICYFVFPGQDDIIRSVKYRPFTYSEYRAQVQQDVKTLGFKVGLSRFKLD